MESMLKWNTYTELCSLAWEGEREAAAELIRRTCPDAAASAGQIIRDGEVLALVLREAYVTGFRNLDRLKEPEEYPLWIQQIAAAIARKVLARNPAAGIMEVEADPQLLISRVMQGVFSSCCFRKASGTAGNGFLGAARRVFAAMLTLVMLGFISACAAPSAEASREVIAVMVEPPAEAAEEQTLETLAVSTAAAQTAGLFDSGSAYDAGSSFSGDWHTAYEIALLDYQVGWSSSSEKWMNNFQEMTDCLPSVRGSDMIVFHTNEALYYALHDLDKNGIPELLIGVSYNGEEPQVYDALYSAHSCPVHLSREGFTVIPMNDGYFLEVDYMGTVCHVSCIDRGCYIENGVDPLLGRDFYSMENVTDHGGCAGGFDWKKLPEGIILRTGKQTFDTVRLDILRTCTITDYDENPGYYDEQYRHLGEGVVNTLTHRDDGVHNLPVWTATRDIDNDGHNELCVGIALTAQHGPKVFVYYNTEDDAVPVCGDDCRAVVDQYPDGLIPINWKNWEYASITGKIA